MDSSIEYYNNNTIKVVKDFLLVGNSRHSLKDINGVFVSKQANYRKYPITYGIFNIIGGLSFYYWFPSFGKFLIICAIVLFILAYMMKTKYVLRLRTNFGETRPIISTDPQELETIKKAILTAIHSS